MKIISPVIFLMVLCGHAFTQDKSPIKFGKVSAADFNLSAYPFDTAAEAVIIADVGNTEFEGNKHGNFDISFKRTTRIKILKKSGLAYANISKIIYHGKEVQERIENIRAFSYNLENGNVKQTPMDEKVIFTEEYDAKHTIKKFVIPEVKEGTIIEYQYTFKSNGYYFLPDWNFQSQIPTLWSQCAVAIPTLYGYALYKQGSVQSAAHSSRQFNKLYYIKDPKSDMEVNAQDHVISINATVIEDTWTMKLVPAMKEEPYSSTVENYITKIKFQLAKYYPGDGTEKDQSTTWLGERNRLVESATFGDRFLENTSFMDPDMKAIVDPEDDQKVKCKKIYAFVRDNFSWNGKFGYDCEPTIKSIWKNRTGNIAEINFVLMSMLKHEGISTDPVIISTAHNGRSIEAYPLLDLFNYLVARVDLPTETVYLDASQAGLAFGHLPAYCYNGHARIINQKAEALYLSADDLREDKYTYASVSYQNNTFRYSVSEKKGYFESLQVRRSISENGQDNFFKAKLAEYSGDVQLKSGNIDSLGKPDYPVTVRYDFTSMGSTADLIYLSPIVAGGYKSNPFSSAERLYPIEMPYALNDTYVFTLIVPEGYELEEMPKSQKISLSSGGSYEYIIAQNGPAIQLKATLIFTKATYPATEYENLREFFARVLKKQAEQIILKKKKD